MTEVNGSSVMDLRMTSDHGGTYGSFTVPNFGTMGGTRSKAGPDYRPGDPVTITGYGSPIIGIVRSVRWSPTLIEVEWTVPEFRTSAAEIIDAAARELAERRPA